MRIFGKSLRHRTNQMVRSSVNQYCLHDTNMWIVLYQCNTYETLKHYLRKFISKGNFVVTKGFDGDAIADIKTEGATIVIKKTEFGNEYVLNH